jgi:hypothetical protein
MDQLTPDPLRVVSTEDFTGQRNGARDSLMLAAQFKVADRPEVTVRVRNLSPGGLMAEYPQPISIGTPVEVEVRGIGWVTGRIAWCAESRVGVAFDGEIDPRAARKPVGTGQTTPVYAKPVITRR